MKKNIFSIVFGIVAIGGMVAAYANYVSYKKSEEKNKRLDSYYHIMQQWIKSKQKNVSLKDTLKRQGCEKIGIYGMGVLGELFYNEAKNEDIDICGFIDKNADILVKGIDGLPIIPIDNIKEQDIDTVVVTPIFDFEKIAMDIKAEWGTHVKVISLDDIYTI